MESTHRIKGEIYEIGGKENCTIWIMSFDDDIPVYASPLQVKEAIEQGIQLSPGDKVHIQAVVICNKFWVKEFIKV